MRKIILLLLLFFITYLHAQKSKQSSCTYYISPLGSDRNSGKSIKKPFKTLKKARNTIREVKRIKGLPKNGITVCLREGSYFLTESFKLKERDSGAEGQPIVYKAYNNEKVRLLGAKKLEASWFKPLSKNSKNFNRLNENVRNKVYIIDLKKHGINDYGRLKERGFGEAKTAALELFSNSQPMILSRWPDKEQNEIKEQSENDKSITLYGKTYPLLKGEYIKYKIADKVPSYKRKELINGLQYYLYRHTWDYQGQTYTAWFLSTDYAHYPRTKDPFFADYNTKWNNLIAKNGAMGRLSAKNISAINHGYAMIKNVENDQKTFSTYHKDLSKLNHVNSIWFHGFWGNSWSDFHSKGKIQNNSITLNHKPTFGMKKGQYFYIENILEELTTEEEWYLDKKSGILYFYPKGDIKTQELMVSMLEEPLIKLQNTSYIEFKDMNLEFSRGNLMEIDGKSNLLSNLTLSNAGNTAIIIKGHYNKIDKCNIYNTGDSGIRVLGDIKDKKELYKAGNIIENSNIHHTSQWSITFHPAIKINESVGNIIRHNKIHHLPYIAILFEGNKHLIEYNEINHTNLFSSDSGAIYIGRDWGWRGNTIRYNFIHDIHTNFEGDGVHGIYLDDVASGINIYKNIFYNIEDYGVYTGGGRDNIIEQNIFVKTSAFHTDCRGVTAINNKKDSSWNFLEKLSKHQVNYQKGKWKREYPELAKIPNSWEKIQSEKYPNKLYKNKPYYSKWLYPEGTKFRRNRGYQIKTWLHDQCPSVSCQDTFAEISKNYPNDTSLKNIEMSLDENSSLFSLDPKFKEIGIRKQ